MSRLALKISAVHGHTLVFANARIQPIEQRPEWIAEQEPVPGGFYVIDDAGHASFSATLPEDVPAPEPALTPAVMVHPDDHFRYDYLEQCVQVLSAQIADVLAVVERLTPEKTDV